MVSDKDQDSELVYWFRRAVAALKARRGGPGLELAAHIDQRVLDSITDLMRRDFGKAKAFLTEAEALCKPPRQRDDAVDLARARNKALRRRVVYLHLLGRGRELQGRIVDAVKAYLELVGPGGDMLVPSPDEPGLEVRLDIWVGKRIEELLQRAQKEERKRIEEEIDRRRKRAGMVPG